MGTGNPWWLYNVLTASHFAKSPGLSAKKKGKKKKPKPWELKKEICFSGNNENTFITLPEDNLFLNWT